MPARRTILASENVVKFAQKMALFYLVALAMLAWGVAIGRYQVFPFRYLLEIEEFVEGDELEQKTTVVEKIKNDAGLEPTRFLRRFPKRALKGTESLPLPGTKSRRDPVEVFIAPEHREGYRVLFGAFDFEDAFWGGVLLDQDGKLLHTWKLSTQHLTDNEDVKKNMYGVHLTPEGSVLFTHQEAGKGLVRVDACSEVEWSLRGKYHHTITPTGDGSFWTFRGSQRAFDHVLARHDLKTGKRQQTINMRKVRLKNPLIHIFHLQREEKTRDADISHGNDIEPLSKEMARHFPQFAPKDLLVSFRTQNLVFVLDPKSLEVKWWRIGAWDRQHDPDWEPGGRIAVFSNNEITPRKYTDIVGIRPETFEHELLVDGSRHKIRSNINGDHQLTDFGTRMITSTTQGWALEIDQEDKVVFSFVNAYERDKRRSLNISEAHRLPTDYFQEKFWEQCKTDTAEATLNEAAPQ